jgi:hypothetical protein
MSSTVVGTIEYDVRLNLGQLKKDTQAAEKIVTNSSKKIAAEQKKAGKASTASRAGASSSGASGYEAAINVNATKRAAKEAAESIAQYTPQIQRQFLAVERANNQVASSTARSTTAIQKYGASSVQAGTATRSLNVAVGNQVQQQSKLDMMLQGTNKSNGSFASAMGQSAIAIGGVVAGLVTLQATIQVMRQSVTAANEYQSSLTGLSRLSQRFGYSSKEATDAARELSEDGIVTITTAASGLQKLLTAGVGLPDAIKLMQGYKDQAAFGKSSTIDLDTAVGNLAESFYTENSAIGNLSGQTENWTQILEYGASVLGKNVSQLSEKERVQAKLIGQQRLNNLVEGDSAVLAQTSQGQQARLNATLKEMQVTIGQVTNSITGGLIGALAGMTKEQQQATLSIAGGSAAFIGIVTVAPLVIKAIKAIRAAIITVGVATAFASAGLTAVLGAIGGIAAGVGINALIDGMDESADLSGVTADNVDSVSGGLSNASKGAGDLAKQMKKINDQMNEAREDYSYSLAQLVAEKNANIAELRSRLDEEKSAYDNAYNERLTGFNKTQNEELLEHTKKTRQLQNQINFLTKYNTAANAQQLSELQFALARENAEYVKSTALRQDEFEAQTKSASDEYEKRRMENETKLNAELALLEKHREDVLSVRNIMLRDEIENLKRSRDEQLKSLEQQKADITAGLTDINSTVGQKAKERAKTVAEIFNETWDKATKANKEDAVRKYGKGADDVIDNVNRALFPNYGFATGGYTGAGNKDEVAGIVHKGEYVLPKSQVDQTTGMPDLSKMGNNQPVQVTANINLSGVMASSPSDFRAVSLKIGKAINEVLTAKGQPIIKGI